MNAPLRMPVRLARAFVLSLALLGATSSSSAADFFLSVNIAPPPIPVYAQPLCPGPGYLWVPGYWAWGPFGYYWVPGTWVLAPFIGALWTPGYWAWDGVVYRWHAGYWARHVGFYGGIDYGFGYFGVGYTGGYWDHGSFYYNSAVSHVDRAVVHHVFRRDVAHPTDIARVSYNGGPGGTTARPTAAERIAQREMHRAPTPVQLQHERLARSDRALRAAVNRGSPPLAATRPVGRGPLAGHAPPPRAERRMERPYPQATVRGARTERPRPPEMRAPNVRPSDRPTQALPPPAMRPEHTARPQRPLPAAPGAEMHAQSMPRGQPHEGRGSGRHEERRGG